MKEVTFNKFKNIVPEVTNLCTLYKLNYLVYTDGRIKNIKTGQFLNSWKNSNGYLTVKINGNNETIHRIVASCFCVQVDGHNVVNHLDGNKLNNTYTNLEWTTIRKNILHALSNGIHSVKYKKCRLVSPTGEVFIVDNLSEFCRKHNLQQPNLHKVLAGIRKSHKNWKGEYL